MPTTGYPIQRDIPMRIHPSKPQIHREMDWDKVHWE